MKRIVRFYKEIPVVVNSDGTYQCPDINDDWWEEIPVGEDLTEEEFACLNDDGTTTLDVE